MGDKWTSWRHRRVAGLRLADLALAGLLLAVAIPSALFRVPDDGPLWITVPVAAAMTAALAWRTDHPLASVVVVVGAGYLQSVIAAQPGALWALAAYLVAAYSVAANTTEGRAAIGGGLLVAALLLQEWQMRGADYLFVVLVFGGAWLLGRVAQQWRSRATSAELNQDERARLAVADERVRIARELHDIVAHGVSVIAIQADAARAVLPIDPDRAREPLTVISASAREVLDEMRRLLTLLRMAEDDDAAIAPVPRLNQVPDLVSGLQATGLPVVLTMEGDGATLPSAVELSAYRIVQEALTNVIRYAGNVPTVVTVRSTAAAVSVEVCNAPGMPGAAAHGAGHGLLGIRERSALVGGELQVGPTPEGGFRVWAKLPAYRQNPAVAP